MEGNAVVVWAVTVFVIVSVVVDIGVLLGVVEDVVVVYRAFVFVVDPRIVFVGATALVVDVVVVVGEGVVVVLAISQPSRDVPRTSPEGPLKVLTSGISRGPSGDSRGTNTKIDDLMKKLLF